MIILKNLSKQYNKNLDNDLFEKLKKLCSSQNINYLPKENSFYQSNEYTKSFEKEINSKLEAEKQHSEYAILFMNKKEALNQHYINTKNFKWFKYFFIKKPINLLFSLDQFLFEFQKKKPQKRKSSEFLQQLREQKKVRFFYGNLSKKELSKVIEKTTKYQGYFYRNFFSILERRLDVVLYRSGFAKTIPLARQLITHKKILINNKIITIPSYNLKSGDSISVQPKYVDSLSNDILVSFKNSVKKRGLFYSMNKKETKLSDNFGKETTKQDNSFNKDRNTLNLFPNKRNMWDKDFFKKFNTINIEKKSYKITNSLIHLLLKKIDNRANIKIKQNSKQYNNYLTLIKYKPLLSKQAKYLFFSLKKNHHVLSEKKPLFIHSKNLNFFKQKKVLKHKQDYRKQNNKYNLKMNEKKNLAIYRNLIVKMFVLMNYQRLFKHFFISCIKKHFFKKRSSFQNMKILKVGGLKPLHLEISYSLLKIIYLYSPQRLKFPFYINIDLLSRALK